MTAPVSIMRAFEVFENPYNLAKITPPWLNLKVVNREQVIVRAGAEINYVIRWMGLPIKWKTRITSYNPPHGFVDEQESGPYILWRHQHLLEECVDGARISDFVTYQLPLGPLGRIAHGLAVKGQLLEIFRFRQRAIAELLGGRGVEFDNPSILAVS
jgi:ligand-binding SRPBCC domain-containing protein